MNIDGHLDADLLSRRLEPLTTQIKREQEGKFGLIVDILKMTGYDQEARAHYIGWQNTYRYRIKRVAVVTDKALWRMVIAAVGLAAGGEMRSFDSEAKAATWLENAD
jgi:hypothetical protein